MRDINRNCPIKDTTVINHKEITACNGKTTCSVDQSVFKYKPASSDYGRRGEKFISIIYDCLESGKRIC